MSDPENLYKYVVDTEHKKCKSKRPSSEYSNKSTIGENNHNINLEIDILESPAAFNDQDVQFSSNSHWLMELLSTERFSILNESKSLQLLNKLSDKCKKKAILHDIGRTYFNAINNIIVFPSIAMSLSLGIASIYLVISSQIVSQLWMVFGSLNVFNFAIMTGHKVFNIVDLISSHYSACLQYCTLYNDLKSLESAHLKSKIKNIGLFIKYKMNRIEYLEKNCPEIKTFFEEQLETIGIDNYDISRFALVDNIV
jgi:hypothetical protein